MTRARRRLPFIVGGLVVVVAILSVWLGGLLTQDDDPFYGIPTAPNELIETRFWDIKVESATINMQGEGRVAVFLQMTNKTSAGVSYVPEIFGMLLPDGKKVETSTCISKIGTFSPFIETAAECSFYLPDGASYSSPATVEVVVTDQTMTDGLLIDPEQTTSWFKARVALEAPVEEEGW